MDEDVHKSTICLIVYFVQGGAGAMPVCDRQTIETLKDTLMSVCDRQTIETLKDNLYVGLRPTNYRKEDFE